LNPFQVLILPKSLHLVDVQFFAILTDLFQFLHKRIVLDTVEAIYSWNGMKCKLIYDNDIKKNFEILFLFYEKLGHEALT